MPFASHLTPLIALSTARIKEFLREPGALFWTFGFPLLITVALGIAFRNEGPPRAAIAVIIENGAGTGTSGRPLIPVTELAPPPATPCSPPSPASRCEPAPRCPEVLWFREATALSTNYTNCTSWKERRIRVFSLQFVQFV